MLGPILSAGANLLGSAIGTAGRYYSTRWSHEAAREAEDRAWQRQKDYNLKYNLDYNSPVAQMKRLAQAGLNPNLVYGSGASASVPSSVTPAMQARSSYDLGMEGSYDPVRSFYSLEHQRQDRDMRALSVIHQRLSNDVLREQKKIAEHDARVVRSRGLVRSDESLEDQRNSEAYSLMDDFVSPGKARSLSWFLSQPFELVKDYLTKKVAPPKKYMHVRR